MPFKPIPVVKCPKCHKAVYAAEEGNICDVLFKICNKNFLSYFF